MAGWDLVGEVGFSCMKGVEFVQGDIFESGCHGLVDPVNCVGVHGKGLALEFEKRWPLAVRRFSISCNYDSDRVQPGCVRYELVDYGAWKDRPFWILFFPTKLHWRDPSKLRFIEEGLDDLVHVVEECGIKSLAIPALGCGLGGLAWAEVKPLIEKASNEIWKRGVPVRVYAPKE